MSLGDATGLPKQILFNRRILTRFCVAGIMQPACRPFQRCYYAVGKGHVRAELGKKAIINRWEVDSMECTSYYGVIHPAIPGILQVPKDKVIECAWCGDSFTDYQDRLLCGFFGAASRKMQDVLNQVYGEDTYLYADLKASQSRRAWIPLTSLDYGSRLNEIIARRKGLSEVKAERLGFALESGSNTSWDFLYTAELPSGQIEIMYGEFKTAESRVEKEEAMSKKFPPGVKAIVMGRFLQRSPGFEVVSGKDYGYLSHRDDMGPGEYCTVMSPVTGPAVIQITTIYKAKDGNLELVGYRPSKWIIDKVDMTTYDRRGEAKEKFEKLKKSLTSRKAELESELILNAIAEMNEDAARDVMAYRSLLEEFGFDPLR